MEIRCCRINYFFTLFFGSKLLFLLYQCIDHNIIGTMVTNMLKLALFRNEMEEQKKNSARTQRERGAYVNKPISGLPRREAERAEPDMKPAVKPVFSTIVAESAS